MNFSNYQSELYVSTNLKKVKYDGRIYEVKSVKIIEPDSLDFRHKCVDGCNYSVNFDQYITYQDQSYYVFFCNKCKTLFLKPML